MRPGNRFSRYVYFGVTAFLVIAASLLLFFAFFHFKDIRMLVATIARILRPVFIGLVLSFLLLPVHRRVYAFLLSVCEKAKLNSTQFLSLINLAAIVLSMLFFAVVIYILLAFVCNQVYVSVVGLIQAIPGYFSSVQNWLTDFLKDNPSYMEFILPYYTSIADSIEERLQSDLLPKLESVNSTIAWIRAEILPSLTSVASNVSAMVIAFFVLLKDLLISVIVSVYLLMRKDILAAQSKKIVYSLLPTRLGDLLVEETRSAYRILSGFINGKLVDSLIIGIICLVCCNLFSFPYAALVATVVGVTNIIPFFGPFIGAIPCAFLILLVSPKQCLYFIVFILILQQFDGNILGPKILGNSTGLDAFWVLFSILLFGGLFGFAGMVLGVPVFAMIYSAISRLVRHGLTRHQLPTETSEYIGKTAPLAKPSNGVDDWY